MDDDVAFALKELQTKGDFKHINLELSKKEQDAFSNLKINQTSSFTFRLDAIKKTKPVGIYTWLQKIGTNDKNTSLTVKNTILDIANNVLRGFKSNKTNSIAEIELHAVVPSHSTYPIWKLDSGFRFIATFKGQTIMYVMASPELKNELVNSTEKVRNELLAEKTIYHVNKGLGTITKDLVYAHPTTNEQRFYMILKS